MKRIAFLPPSLNLPSVLCGAVWTRCISFYYHKPSLAGAARWSNLPEQKEKNRKPYCSYKTNGEHRDGAAAPGASPRAPRAYLGG